jgi:hypothetical protein
MTGLTSNGNLQGPTSSSMPDLNSVPPSPHGLAGQPQAATMRRASSQQMPPPPVPPSPSINNILPSNQRAVTSTASPPLIPPPSLPQNMTSATELPGGPGPARFPEPLTAADLHNQLEKEQEAVVCPFPCQVTVPHADPRSPRSTVSPAS